MPDPVEPDSDHPTGERSPRRATPRHAGPARRRGPSLLGRNVLLGRARRRPVTPPGAPQPATEERSAPSGAASVEESQAADEAQSVVGEDSRAATRAAPRDSTETAEDVAPAEDGAGDDAAEPEEAAQTGAAADKGPVDKGPVDKGPVDKGPVDKGPVDKGPGETGRARLAAVLRRPGRGQIVIAVLLLVFGLGLVTQLQLVDDDSTYDNARREDLIQILDGLTNENRRLESELGELESTRTRLQSGADAQRVAREEARKRIEQLSILAGLVPVEGPGIRMVISDPNNAVTAQVLLDAIEELRDAGAEVIEINDAVRLVASSWFGHDERGLLVDGIVVTRPIIIEAIGDPHSLAEGANFRGGIVSEITSTKIGGSVEITEVPKVQITSLHTEKKNQYARPASRQPS